LLRAPQSLFLLKAVIEGWGCSNLWEEASHKLTGGCGGIGKEAYSTHCQRLTRLLQASPIAASSAACFGSRTFSR